MATLYPLRRSAVAINTPRVPPQTTTSYRSFAAGEEAVRGELWPFNRLTTSGAGPGPGPVPAKQKCGHGIRFYTFSHIDTNSQNSCAEFYLSLWSPFFWAGRDPPLWHFPHRDRLFKAQRCAFGFLNEGTGTLYRSSFPKCETFLKSGKFTHHRLTQN